PRQFGPHKFPGLEDGILRMPNGSRCLRGIPFWLGPEGVEQKSWIILSTRGSTSATPAIEIPVRQKASFICMAAFCDWDENEDPPMDAGPEVFQKVGQCLADASFIYADGTEEVLPIRRRFEVNEAIQFLHESLSPCHMWRTFPEGSQ